jgi:hypothetical protein
VIGRRFHRSAKKFFDDGEVGSSFPKTE